MRLVALNIRYDPELEGTWQDPVAHADWLEENFPSNKKPRFPYSWKQGGVGLPFGLTFVRKEVHYGGPDPWSGLRWTLDSRHLVIELESVLCASIELSIFGHKFERRAYSWPEMPGPWRWLIDALSYRYDWYMQNEYVEDPYGSLEDYE